jgi:hypothetical protein
LRADAQSITLRNPDIIFREADTETSAVASNAANRFATDSRRDARACAEKILQSRAIEEYGSTRSTSAGEIDLITRAAGW